MKIGWFSAGVDSAISIKLSIKTIDKIVYTHIDDQHKDTMRFLRDCESWFGKEIEIIQSDKKNVESACLSAGGRGYLNGVAGAACTNILKKKGRHNWQKQYKNMPLEYVWGLDSSEEKRVERIEKAMPGIMHHFPLIENGYSKTDTHQTLKASGLKRPKMYDLGYNNNNCVGCIKGGKGYWNKIRQDFIDVFESRAKLERKIQASMINGVYLDELEPSKGRIPKAIIQDCGLMCEFIKIKN